jgi:hypothetical protein
MKELIKKIPFIYVMIKKIWNPIKVKKAESNFRRLIENMNFNMEDTIVKL